MRLFDQLFKRRKTETWQRTVAEDPDTVFYVREWACKVNGRRDDVAAILGANKPRTAAWVDGILTVDGNRRAVFVVEYEHAVFAFAQGDIGFTDFAARLSRGGGSAYTAFLDDKRSNILCTRASDGRMVRQLAFAEGVLSEQGTRDPREPVLGEDGLTQTRALELAATWGPDPRALVRAAPIGWLYTR